MELGATATAFESRTYGEELALCQRYCYVIEGVNKPISTSLSYATNNSNGVVPFPVTMRTSPSTSYLGVDDFQVTNGSGTALTTTSVGNYVISPVALEFTTTVSGGGLTVGQAGLQRTTGGGTAKITLSAEL